jgi:amino acid adenylation domain-containing protein/non-ribosomal peptide synthase protein (TIGR01720 family)
MERQSHAAIDRRSERLAHLSAAKRALFERLRNRDDRLAPVGRIPRRDAKARAPLSFAQERLWFLDQLEPANPFYNVALAIRLAGPLDAGVLVSALTAVVARHSALRTTYRNVDGRPEQVVCESAEFQLTHEDLASLAPPAREARLRDLVDQEALGPFDLAQGPLLRGVLVRLDAGDHTLLLTLHHIVCDGWSMAVLRDEIAEHYTAAIEGRVPRVEPLALEYADFAAWQRDQLTSATAERDMGYWRHELAGSPGVLELPLDHPRPAVQAYNGDVCRRRLDGPLASELRRLARQENATLCMVLMAAFHVLLARFSGARDLCVGTPIAGRSRPELERLVGFFANTLVIRGRLEANPSFREFLGQIRQSMLGAYAHQDFPIEKLVDELHVKRDLARNPLVQVLFVLQNIPLRTRDVAGLSIRELSFDHARVANFDLTLNIDEHADHLDCGLVYNTDLFEAMTIERMLDAYCGLLEAIAADSDRRVLGLPILSAAEHRRVLVDWIDTAANFPRDRCIHDLIVEQARRTPDAPALVSDDRAVTYAELDRKSNRLARLLIERGAAVDVPIGLCVDRSPDLAVAMLAVLKAGAAYLPLDPQYPLPRRAFMIADAQVPLVISESALADCLPPGSYRHVLLDRERDAIAAASDEPLPPRTAPSSLAYVIYTSGSTGEPKGVEVEHRSLVNHALALAQLYGLSGDDRLLQYLSLSFDAAAEEIFPTLVSGAALYLHRSPRELSGRALLDWSREHGVNVLHLPVPIWSSLVDELTASGRDGAKHLKCVLAGGDSVPAEQLRRWRELTGGRVHFLFAYGVTEATITSTIFDDATTLPATSSSALPIGRPIANNRVYVLDEFAHPVPAGVAGELYIGGAGVARGYRGRNELTAERFLRDRFASDPEARMYRTGDLARWLADGTLEFLGRVDRQVKVRGYRIEPAEIEAVLQLHDHVREAIVITIGAGEAKRLAAYVGCGPGEPPSNQELHDFLAARLPAHMIPAAIVALEQLPRLACSKVDVSSLPAPCWQQSSATAEFVEPRNDIERALATVWQDILGVERVGIRDNFFDLGGDSIRSIQVVARAGAAGVRITPKQLFEHQTIGELAAVAGTARAITAPQEPVTGPIALLPVQREFFALGPAEPHHYNQAILLTLERRITADFLDVTIDKLLAHHDMLRARYSRTADGQWQQTLAPVEGGGQAARVDLSRTADDDLAAAIEHVAAAAQASLNLEHGPLTRFVYFDLGANRRGRLLIVIHHLVIDTVSWRILLADLNVLLNQLLAGASAELPAKTTPVRDWAARLVELADGDANQAEARFWTARGDEPPLLTGDADAHSNVAGSAGTVSVSLDVANTRQLLGEAASASHARSHELLIAALVQVVSEFCGARILRLDLEGHGREALFDDVDLSRTVGWFTTLYPIVLRLSPSSSRTELLKSVKQQLRAIPRSGIGYGLLRWLTSHGDVRNRLAAQPAAEMCFNYLGQFDHALPGDALVDLAAEPTGPSVGLRNTRRHQWEIIAYVRDKQLQVEWNYNGAIHATARIEQLAENYIRALQTLVEDCLASGASAVTPSDFPLSGVDQDDLDALARLIDGDA